MVRYVDRGVHRREEQCYLHMSPSHDCHQDMERIMKERKICFALTVDGEQTTEKITFKSDKVGEPLMTEAFVLLEKRMGTPYTINYWDWLEIP